MRKRGKGGKGGKMKEGEKRKYELDEEDELATSRTRSST